MSKIDAFDKKINDFRKMFTVKYYVAENSHDEYNKLLDKRFYNKAANKSKIAKPRPDFDMNTSTILAPYLIQWQTLINDYKKLAGKEYKKPILYNAGKEESLAANQAEKEAAREARDVKLEEQRKKRPAPPRPKKISKAKQELLKQYNMTENEYDEMVKAALKKNPTKYDPSKDKKYVESIKPAPKLEEVVLPTSTVPVKVTKSLFSDMADIVNTIIENERKIPGMQPFYSENKDRTGKLLTADEIAQLKSIRARISKIPENVIIAPIEIKQEVKRKRGRPVVEGSKRQQALAAPKPEAKRRGRPPKKITVEETKEETKQEETKEELAPKKRRGRPVVEGSKRQQALAAPVVKRPRGRPKKEAVEAAPKAKVGRPSKCSSVLPKSNTPTPNVFTRPIIEYVDIDKKFKLSASQMVSPLLLKYSKMNKNIFFDIMDTLFKGRLDIMREIKNKPSKNTLFIIYKKVCEFAVFYGFATAYQIEESLILRIKGDLQDKPKELARFIGFLKKNCIGQGSSTQTQKAMPRTKKDKKYSLQELAVFYEVPIAGKILKEEGVKIDEIFRDVFVGQNASIRMNGDKIEIVDYETDEDGNALPNKVWQEVRLKKTLLKGLVKRITEAVKEVVDDDAYKGFIKDFTDDPQYVYDALMERIPNKDT
jgi:hypothetical protein